MNAKEEIAMIRQLKANDPTSQSIIAYLKLRGFYLRIISPDPPQWEYRVSQGLTYVTYLLGNTIIGVRWHRSEVVHLYWPQLTAYMHAIEAMERVNG